MPLIKQYKYMGQLGCAEKYGRTIVGAKMAELDIDGFPLLNSLYKWFDAIFWIADESEIQAMIDGQNQELQSQDLTKHKNTWCLKNINDLKNALRDLENPSKQRTAIKKHLRIEYRPSFIRAPLKSLLTKYLIEDGEVKIRKSFMGVKFGSRPELPVKSVTAVHANGLIWGSVVFNDISGQPVVWDKVFRPEKVLKIVKEKLRSWEEFNINN